MKTKVSIILILVFFCFISCDNEDVDDVFQVNTQDLIAQDSELFGLLERATSDDTESGLKPITCIKFIYSFTVVVYNENTALERSVVVRSDTEFSELLGSVAEGSYVGVSFPITSELPDGTTFEVQDKDELKIAIDACVLEEQEEVIGQCEGLLQTCVWEVQLPEDNSEFDTYENAVFSVNEDGTVDFFHRGVRHRGTWIVYFIEEELHININLVDDYPEDSYTTDFDWNFDWNTAITDSYTMEITTDGGKEYILKQQCEPQDYCTTLRFTECEAMDTPGIAQFLLTDYVACIDIIASPEPVDENTSEDSEQVEFEFIFYMTQEDADGDLNRLDGTIPFSNSENPQDIYVRIVNPESDTFEIVIITLVAVNCP